MKRFSVLVLLVSGVWLTFGSAHAVEQSAEDPSAQEALTVQEILQRDPSAEDYGESPRCIDTKRIRRINVLDDKHVVFEMSRDQFFLAQFERRCPGLRRNKTVMTEPTGSRLCRLDTIRALEEWGLGNYQPGMPCHIPGFQNITKEQVMQLKDTLKATKRKNKNRP